MTKIEVRNKATSSIYITQVYFYETGKIVVKSYTRIPGGYMVSFELLEFYHQSK